MPERSEGGRARLGRLSHEDEAGCGSLLCLLLPDQLHHVLVLGWGRGAAAGGCGQDVVEERTEAECDARKDGSPEQDRGDTDDRGLARKVRHHRPGDQEGCGGLDPVRILEAWSRHTLLWLNTIEDAEGRTDLHREWAGLAWKLGETVSVATAGTRVEGTFLGVDENFGMLLKTNGTTRLLPLSSLLEEV